MEVIIPLTLSRSSIFLSSEFVLPEVASILYLFPFLSVVKYSISLTILSISGFFRFIFFSRLIFSSSSFLALSLSMSTSSTTFLSVFIFFFSTVFSVKVVSILFLSISVRLFFSKVILLLFAK